MYKRNELLKATSRVPLPIFLIANNTKLTMTKWLSFAQFCKLISLIDWHNLKNRIE